MFQGTVQLCAALTLFMLKNGSFLGFSPLSGLEFDLAGLPGGPLDLAEVFGLLLSSQKTRKTNNICPALASRLWRIAAVYHCVESGKL